MHVTDQALTTLVDLADGIGRAPLPPKVEERAVNLVLDSVACGIGGWDSPTAHAIIASMALDGVGTLPQGPAIMLGSSGRAPMDLAACWNTALIRYLDFNDLTSSGHPSDMVGAMLAVGSATSASGREMLQGLVIAYEVYGRLADQILKTNKTLDQGYAVAVGTAAMTTHLLGGDEVALRHAIALAATACVPLRATRSGQLSHYKGGATAIAVRDGVFLGQLAAAGLTGPEAPFEGRHGIVELLDGEAGQLKLEGRGRWIILESCLKYFPMAYNMQPSVWAALELREVTTDLERVKEVVLMATPFSWHESGSEPEKWDPRTRETADHSIPYVFAHAFRHGTVDDAAYEPSAIRDPLTLELMRRIRVEPDWSRGGIDSGLMGVEGILTLTDESVHHVRVDEPLGHFRNPMGPEALMTKALSLLEPRLGAVTARAAVEALGGFAELDAERFAVLVGHLSLVELA